MTRRAIDPAIINARDEDGCDNVDHLRSVDTRRVYNFQRGGPTGIQNMVPTTERRSRRMAIRNLASRNKAGPGIGLSSQAASHASARSVSRHVPYIRNSGSRSGVSGLSLERSRSPSRDDATIRNDTPNYRDPVQDDDGALSDDSVVLLPEGRPPSPMPPPEIATAIAACYARAGNATYVSRQALRATLEHECKLHSHPTQRIDGARRERVHMTVVWSDEEIGMTIEYDRTYTVSNYWYCALCERIGPLPTREMLQCHYDRDHYDDGNIQSFWEAINARGKRPTWEHRIHITRHNLLSPESGDSDDTGSEPDPSGTDSDTEATQEIITVSSDEDSTLEDQRRRTVRVSAQQAILPTSGTVLRMPASESPVVSSPSYGSSTPSYLETTTSRSVSLALSSLQDEEISLVGSSAPRRARPEQRFKFEADDTTPSLTHYSDSFIGPDATQWLKPPLDKILGPAVQPPYLPFTSQNGSTTLTHSCRPGGARIYDLLDLVPNSGGVEMQWLIEKEEDLFEYDNIPDDVKVALAVWARWVFHNPSVFLTLKQRSEGMQRFVDDNIWILHHAAGFGAVRSLFTALVADKLLIYTDMARALGRYKDILQMKQWYADDAADDASDSRASSAMV